MAGAQPGTMIAVEVFIEENVVAPERIILELFRAAVDGSPPTFVTQENPGEPASPFFVCQDHLTLSWREVD